MIACILTEEHEERTMLEPGAKDDPMVKDLVKVRCLKTKSMCTKFILIHTYIPISTHSHDSPDLKRNPTIMVCYVDMKNYTSKPLHM